jgi:pimeloyl-ACP methyl ester carboxylesterase
MTESTGTPSVSGAHASPPPTPLFPDNIQFWYETVRAFGAASYGGSEFGEVLATTGRIRSGDVDSWYAEWNATAEKVANEATAQLAQGHHTSARDGFLRAATYYRSADFFLHANPRDPRIADAYRKSVECYEASAKLFEPAIQPVEIPYEHTTLPGYFHRIDDSDRRRPLLICHSGYDGSAQEMHVDGARAAVDRGYIVLAFDGPGQYGPLHREGLTFRADWEKVVSPAVEFALGLPGVDPDRIALMGNSLGGELAPRAAAFEKRLAALIANDGVIDFGAATLGTVPANMRDTVLRTLTAPEAPQLDQMIAASMQSSPTAAWTITHGMWALGASTPRAFVAASQAYNLHDGIAEAITCPTLVCDAEGDMFFRGQPEELYARLTCLKAIAHFSTSEGAGLHCQVGAGRLAFARIFDWLDQTFGLV